MPTADFDALLTARNLKPNFYLDTTRLVAQHSGSILYDHDFSDPVKREAGFTHLWTPGENANCGATMWINRGGTGRVAVVAPIQTGGEAMGICRMSQYFGDGVYLFEFNTSIETMNMSQDYPRWYNIGLDTANVDGTQRRFFQLRYLNYDQTANARASRWQLIFENNRAVDIPGGNLKWWDNENKALPMKIDMMVDTRTGRYLGLRLGRRLAVGTLAAVPDNSLRDLGPIESHSLVSFADGMNMCFSVANRSTGTKSMGQINCHHARLTFLGETYV